MAESLNTELRADLLLDLDAEAEDRHRKDVRTAHEEERARTAGTSASRTAHEMNTAADYSPLVLAYMGDAVWELIVRTKIVRAGNRQVNHMHHDAVRYVKAETQARLIRLIEPELTAREAGVYRRGRNAHSNTMAKNASMIDYRMATGFEALVGYLWLNGEETRLMSLLRLAVRRLEGKLPPDGSKEAGAAAASAEHAEPEESLETAELQGKSEKENMI